MTTEAINWLTSHITDDTTKKELDIIEFLKKCVKSCADNINNKNSTECEVIEYLNEKAGTRFKPVESNLKFVRARLKDYTIDDLKAVIDKKVKEWKGTNMQVYIRPETLFNATKFETYFNGLGVKQELGKKAVAREYDADKLNSLFDDIHTITV